MTWTLATVTLYTGLSLLIPSTISQDECTLPTNQDVVRVANLIYAVNTFEGTVATVVEELLEVHFTCLATVGHDMYSQASVIVNVTTTSDSAGSTVRQFQLRCLDSTWEQSPGSNFDNSASLLAAPFSIETQSRCSQCELLPNEGNYDPDSNCVRECIYTYI